MSTSYSWKQKQIDNNIPDEFISKRVAQRISRWQKRSDYLEEINVAIHGATEEMNQHAPGTTKYNKKKAEIKAMNEALKNTSDEVEQLNAELCADMDRLKSNEEAIIKSRERLEKNRTQSAPGHTQPEIIPAEQQPGQTQGIPIMITADMRKQLHDDLLYSEEDINAMTPDQAHGLIVGQVKKEQSAANNELQQPLPITETQTTQKTEENIANTTAAPSAQRTQKQIVPSVATKQKPADGKKSNVGLILGAIFGALIGVGIGYGIKKASK